MNVKEELLKVQGKIELLTSLVKKEFISREGLIDELDSIGYNLYFASSIAGSDKVQKEGDKVRQ